MKRVLILSTTTGYQTRSFDAAALALGVELVYGLDQCRGLENPWVGHSVPVRFYDDPRSLHALARANAESPLHGVLALGDRPTVLASEVAEAFGLSFHPPDAARVSRNKLLTRQRLQHAHLPVPAFAAVPVDADPQALLREAFPESRIRLAPTKPRASAVGEVGNPESRLVSFPVVVKPLVLSGSRGVIRANTPDQFVESVHRLRHILDAPDVRLMKDPDSRTILIESFIEGREYAVEGLMTEGRLRWLAIFDKPDPLDGPFFEETIYVTPSRAPAAHQSRIVEAVAAAARALGLRHGPVHAECRVNAGGVFVLEAAARPIGGLCARALRFAAAGGATVSFEELLLRHALGEAVDTVSREDGASGVMMIPIPTTGVYRGVDGIEAARGVPRIDDLLITAVPGQHLVTLPDGASYLGFIFARGATSADVVAALRAAHARVRFRIDRELLLAGSGVAPAARHVRDY
ncbi:MAG: ATP-grasp domain-containing protein [Acidobacteriota bacterium]